MLGVNRSTALRLMTEIESLGYVVRDPDTKSYAIAPARFYPFIASHADHLDWSMVVDPILSDLRDEFGEAAIMGVPANGTMVYLAFFPSHPRDHGARAAGHHAADALLGARQGLSLGAR